MKDLTNSNLMESEVYSNYGLKAANTRPIATAAPTRALYKTETAPITYEKEGAVVTPVAPTTTVASPTTVTPAVTNPIEAASVTTVTPTTATKELKTETEATTETGAARRDATGEAVATDAIFGMERKKGIMIISISALVLLVGGYLIYKNTRG